MSAGQRAVCKVTEKDGELYLPLSDLRALVKIADKFDLDAKYKFKVSKEGDTFHIIGELPRHIRIVKGKKVRIRRRLKHERAVEAQIESHRKKKARGEDEGYVPPVGRSTAPKKKKVKCPECGVRKPLVRIAGVVTLKPHTSQGEPCSGSGMQVGVGRK